MGNCLGSNSNFNKKIISIEHFEVERVLGKGGFGKVNAVKKITAPHKGEWYAMKTMDKKRLLHSTKGDAARIMVFAERNILAQVHHPFICNSHFAFQDDYNLYIVMDLAVGGDLRYQLSITENGFDEERCRFYIAQCVLALCYLHSKKIIHRDIKPDNMLMDAKGYCKLSDFGLSRTLPEDGYCREGGGTLSYMAPEIYLVKGHKHSYPSDWWSVGIMTYEFLTKRRPYHQSELKEMTGSTAHKVLRFEKDSPAYEKLAPFSDEVKDFIYQLLRINPNKRLGANGDKEVQFHPWLQFFDYKSLISFKYPSVPYVPRTDEANCSNKYEVDDLYEQNRNKMNDPFVAMQNELFRGYEYNITNDEEEENRKRHHHRHQVVPIPQKKPIGGEDEDDNKREQQNHHHNDDGDGENNDENDESHKSRHRSNEVVPFQPPTPEHNHHETPNEGENNENNNNNNGEDERGGEEEEDKDMHHHEHYNQQQGEEMILDSAVPEMKIKAKTILTPPQLALKNMKKQFSNDCNNMESTFSRVESFELNSGRPLASTLCTESAVCSGREESGRQSEKTCEDVRVVEDPEHL